MMNLSSFNLLNFSRSELNSTTDTPSDATIIPQWSSRIKWMYGFYGIFLLILGTIENILSILTLKRPVLWRLPSSPYLMALAVVDLLALWNGLLPWCLLHVFDIPIHSMNMWIQAISTSLVYFSTCMSGAIVTAIALQRMISVCFPLKAKIWNSRRNIHITLTVLSLVLFLFYISLIFYYISGGTFIVGDRFLCYTFLALIEFILWFCLPFMIILASSIAIIVKLRKSQEFKNKHDILRNNDDRRITAMLLMICLLYILCVLPWCTFYLLLSFRIISVHVSSYGYIFLHACFNGLTYLNNAINFIVYFFTAPNFRKEIKRMLTFSRTV